MVRVEYPIYDQRGRHVAVAYDGATTITYRCPCGREYRIDHARGPIAQRLGAVGCELIYERFRDGCTAKPCAECVKVWKKTGELPKEGSYGLE